MMTEFAVELGCAGVFAMNQAVRVSDYTQIGDHQTEIDRNLFIYKVNVSIGRSIRKIRKLRNLTQTELAQNIDVSFQQIQKYENGTNRISLAALLLICMSLDIPIAQLFADIAENFEPLMTSTQEGQILAAFRLIASDSNPMSEAGWI